MSVALIASGVPLSAQTDRTWARVRRMQPGSEIVFTLRGSPDPRHRHFVSATDTELVVLNLTDPPLERGVIRLVLDFTRKHPEAFTATRPTDVIDGKVHVGSAGVIVSGQKVADLAQLVERTARADVAEVITRHHSPVAKIVIWIAIGFGLAVLAAGTCGQCYG